MAFFSCNSCSSSSSSSLYHLTNPNFLDDDDMLLLHQQQQQHHHFVDEMMMTLTDCLFEGHTGHIAAADGTRTSLVLQEGEVALPVDGDNKNPNLPSQEIPPVEKKRKNTKYIASAETKSKKICRGSNGELEADGAVKASNEEGPPSFVHVRARRGQATDSHSLAERVRRERISVRMKMLQNLVPGCDKMIGKAHILDAIINYVKSLQSQVEFLSTKIASMNSMPEACGVRFDDSMNLQAAHEWTSHEEELMWKMGERTEGPATPMFRSTCCNNYEMMDQVSPSSASLQRLLLLPSESGPTCFSQDGSSCVVQMSEQDQGNCQSNGPPTDVFSFHQQITKHAWRRRNLDPLSYHSI